MIENTFEAFHYFFHTTCLIGQALVLHLKFCYLLCFVCSTNINYFSNNYLHMVLQLHLPLMAGGLKIILVHFLTF